MLACREFSKSEWSPLTFNVLSLHREKTLNLTQVSQTFVRCIQLLWMPKNLFLKKNLQEMAECCQLKLLAPGTSESNTPLIWGNYLENNGFELRMETEHVLFLNKVTCEN